MANQVLLRAAWAIALMVLTNACSPLPSGSQSASARDWLGLRAGARWVYRAEQSVASQVGGLGPVTRGAKTVRVEGAEPLVGVDGAYTLATYLEVRQDEGEPEGAVGYLARVLAVQGAEIVEIGSIQVQNHAYPADRLVRHEDARILMRRGAGLGDSWALRYKDPRGLQTRDLEAEVLGFEDVQTPAGRFEGCLKLRVAGEIRGRHARSGFLVEIAESSYEQVMWYAEGVGKVREERKIVVRGTTREGESASWEEHVGLTLLEHFPERPDHEIPDIPPLKPDPDEPLGQELARLIEGRQFARADELLAAYQREFEQGERSSSSIRTLYAGFRDAEADSLDAWVDQRKVSAWARVARGTHATQQGWKGRGGDVIGETSVKRLAGMRAAFDRAVADHKVALELGPKQVISYGDLLGIARARGQADVGRVAFEELVALESDPFDAYLAYLPSLEPKWGGSMMSMVALTQHVLVGHGQGELADRVMAEIQARFARMAERNGDTTRAFKHWDAAVTASDRYRWARADLYAETGQFGKALFDIERGMQISDEAPYVMLLRAEVFEQLGYPELALADLRGAGRLVPHDATFPEREARLAYVLGDHDRSVEAWDRVTTAQPDDAELWRRKGEFLFLRLRRPEPALEAMKRSLELDPNDPYAYFDYARLLYGAKDAGAQEAFLHFLEMAEGDPALAIQVVSARQFLSNYRSQTSRGLAH